MSHPSRRSQLPRVAAVVSAIVLVGLYIVYRSGGEVVLPSSKSARVHPVQGREKPAATTAPTTNEVATTAPAIVAVTQPSEFLFSGSKSGAVFTPATLRQQNAAAPTSAPAAVQPAAKP
ncbi:MAG: hypothetical protein QOF78_1373 [Phycisphaerales bacterium]|jgi:hypothetical protein|nr:hypothetical protein [Phycisphaerales bacterium]